MKKTALDTTTKSFEEVYKTSYSHGLESIYRIENIDLKTVRRLGDKSEKAEKADKLSKELVKEPQKKQLSNELVLDLGPVFNGYLKSFVVQESIQSLKLSKHTEKCLLDQGLRTIGDLKKSDLSSLVFVKGIGQGHVEEVRESLTEYTKNKPLEKADKIDFSSWILSLLGDIETKMAWALLEPFGLSDLLTLTALESVEIKKLTLERKLDLRETAKQKLNNPEKVKETRSRFEEIEAVVVRPWILQREGVATEDEVAERLQRCSEEPKKAQASLIFLKTFFPGSFPLHLVVEQGLIFADVESWSRFKKVEQSALSYLWNFTAEIPVDQLYMWLFKDFAKSWISLPQKLFQKVVKLSPLLERNRPLYGDLLIKRRNVYIRA